MLSFCIIVPESVFTNLLKHCSLQAQELARGGMDNKDEKMERVIRIGQWTYDNLSGIGKMGMDFDDVVIKLIMEYIKRHGG